MTDAAIKGKLRTMRLCALTRQDFRCFGVVFAAKHEHLACVRFLERLSFVHNDDIICLGLNWAARNNNLAITRYILDCGRFTDMSGYSDDAMRWSYPFNIIRYLVWRFSGNYCCVIHKRTCKPAMCWFWESLSGCRCKCCYCK